MKYYTPLSKVQREEVLAAMEHTLNNSFPIFDYVTKDVGVHASALFGIFVRACLLNASGICTRTKIDLAKELGVSRRTVCRHIYHLCHAGYLIDLNPDENSRAHSYALTDKLFYYERDAM